MCLLVNVASSIYDFQPCEPSIEVENGGAISVPHCFSKAPTLAQISELGRDLEDS